MIDYLKSQLEENDKLETKLNQHYMCVLLLLEEAKAEQFQAALQLKTQNGSKLTNVFEG